MSTKSISIFLCTLFLSGFLLVPFPTVSDHTALLNALNPVNARAEEALKAGMVDPRTGKKIKYWVAPMDPTYIRNEPG